MASLRGLKVKARRLLVLPAFLDQPVMNQKDFEKASGLKAEAARNLRLDLTSNGFLVVEEERLGSVTELRIRLTATGKEWARFVLRMETRPMPLSDR
ncbi:MAG TPA: hypothetical protein VHH36_05165 [Candidatus Thermoplasmatota archaeon]|nr:hypothetical protein [Candidatus Thermoplasmatota archaeon]